MQNNQTSALDTKLLVALSIYLISLFASNVLGAKLMPFFWGTQLSVGVFCFPVVFIMTDVIGEIYGKPTAKLFVTCGLMSMVLFILYTYIVLLMPWGDRALWMRESYDKIFKLSARISIASVAAYAIAEYQDVFSFFLAKKFFGEKYFWLRSNISNVWSQFLDSAIFMFIAFLGVYPLKTILLIIIPWWIYKTLMGFAYTPLSYFGLYLLRKDYGSKACKNAGI